MNTGCIYILYFITNFNKLPNYCWYNDLLVYGWLLLIIILHVNYYKILSYLKYKQNMYIANRLKVKYTFEIYNTF